MPAEAKAAPRRVNPVRENVENIAVVLAMVCLLRGFVAEAFVIPTGSMATTLHGANRKIACPECGHVTALNLSHVGAERPGGWCMNCRFPLAAAEASGLALGESGDRIVASKYAYELGSPQRWDTPIFKYPARFSDHGGGSAPTSASRTNFIKRIVGVGPEELIIDGGNVWTRPDEAQPYAIAAKHPAAILATRRLVWDNDRPAKDLLAEKFPPRWAPDDPKAAEPLDGSKSFSVKGSVTLVYRHLLGGGERDAAPLPMRSAAAGRVPQLITDFEAYNYVRTGNDFHNMFGPPNNWVGELTLEARLSARSNVGTIAFELNQASRRCRCEFDLSARQIRLKLNGQELAAAAFPPQTGNAFAVRFANIDDHCTVWLDERLVFPKSVALPELPARERGPTLADLQPAKIVAESADALVSGIKLWRDIHYTTPIDGRNFIQRPDHETLDGSGRLAYPMEPGTEADTIAEWARRLAKRHADVRAEKLGPDFPMNAWHVKVPADSFFMLGDNSPMSSDARFWDDHRFAGKDAMLGKPVFVFWPLETLPWQVRFVH